MVTNYLGRFKVAGLVALFIATAYFSYDYGVTSAERSNQRAQNTLLDKLEQKQNEAFLLAVKLAKQQPMVDIQYRTIEKEVIKYAQANNNKQCVASDANWLRIRSDAVRAHNRAIGIQQPATVSNDAPQATGSQRPYQQDAEVLAEDVVNLKTCTENAQKLYALQEWIKAQIE